MLWQLSLIPLSSYDTKQEINGGIRELRIKQKLTEYLQLKEEGDKSRLSKAEFIELFKVGGEAGVTLFCLAEEN